MGSGRMSWEEAFSRAGIPTGGATGVYSDEDFENITPKQAKARSDAQKKRLDKERKEMEKIQREQKKVAKDNVKADLDFLRHKNSMLRRFSGKNTYTKLGSYVRNVGIPGVYGPGGAEEYSGYKPKGVGGGGEIGGRFGKALKLGALAVGIYALTKVLQRGLQYSKIANVISDSINKALGLLVDVILLPFLPQIAYGIVQLFNSIMVLKQAWDDILKKGLLKFILDWAFAEVEKWKAKLLQFIFDPGSVSFSDIVSFVLSLKDFVFPAFAWLGRIIEPLLNFLFGTENVQALKDLVFNIGADIMKGASTLMMNILNFLFVDAPLKIKDIIINVIPKLQDPTGLLGGSHGWGGSSSAFGAVTSGNYSGGGTSMGQDNSAASLIARGDYDPLHWGPM